MRKPVHRDGDGPRSLQLENRPQPSTAKNETKLKKTKQLSRHTWNLCHPPGIRSLAIYTPHLLKVEGSFILRAPGQRGEPTDRPTAHHPTMFMSCTLFPSAIPEGICSQNILHILYTNWLNYETIYQPFILHAALMGATHFKLGSGSRARWRNGVGGGADWSEHVGRTSLAVRTEAALSQTQRLPYCRMVSSDSLKYFSWGCLCSRISFSFSWSISPIYPNGF